MQHTGRTGHEAEAYGKLKWFCSQLVKKIVPPLLKKVQASALRPEAELFTPRHTTRGSRKAATTSSKAIQAENVLMRALGLAHEDMDVDEGVISDLKELFDSPLREQHVRVIVALFGKEMPTWSEMATEPNAVVGAA